MTRPFALFHLFEITATKSGSRKLRSGCIASGRRSTFARYFTSSTSGNIQVLPEKRLLRAVQTEQDFEIAAIRRHPVRLLACGPARIPGGEPLDCPCRRKKTELSPLPAAQPRFKKIRPDSERLGDLWRDLFAFNTIAIKNTFRGQGVSSDTFTFVEMKSV
jgi:hypothetical protein